MEALGMAMAHAIALAPAVGGLYVWWVEGLQSLLDPQLCEFALVVQVMLQ